MDKKIRKGKIEKIVNGGFGLIRSDEGIVLLSYVAPGETIKYRIRERARGINWGSVIEIEDPYTERIVPDCKYYGECGGCVLSHLKYEDQIRIKKAILTDDLKRIGKLEIDSINLITSPSYKYRARAKLKGLWDGKIGLIRKGTNEVIQINSCLIVAPEINQFISRWNNREGMPFFHQLDIFFNETDKNLYIHLSAKPEKEDLRALDLFENTVFSWKGKKNSTESVLKIGETNYIVSPDTFFQVNRFQWKNMLDIVDSWMGKCGLSIDLYTGNGFFIPVLLKYSDRVIGVENSKRSVELAKRSFKKAEFLRMPVEKFNFPEADTIIIDPPRSGIPRNVIQKIIEIKPGKIINISCSTATLARDLSYFVDNGYKIEEMFLIDMFPHTAHMETMTLLRSQ